ncbi:MAG TPA: nuclear transport factor 2 family protein [Steroidobacteraceae bacterium]|jgi:hypothetical protein|nr:nuclear transport factor 2 family protein [Steroidobacteraceae bacterium]
MATSSNTLIDLENRFWQSLVDQDTDSALELLSQPALMVGEHGAMKFDHAGYRKMAEKGPMVLTRFELSKMDVLFPNDSTAVLTYHVKQEVAPRGDGKPTVQEMHDTSIWIKQDDGWKCVMHTETPAGAARTSH